MTMHFNGKTGPAETTAVAVENTFDFRSDEYRALYDGCEVSGFQSPLWLDQLYRVLVPGVGAKPVILTVRQGGRLKAVFPLIRQDVAGVTMVQAADLGVSDYNRIVCTAETLEALAADETVRSAIADHIAFADILFLRKVGRDEAVLDRLFGKAERSSCENSAYVIDLEPGAFEEWRRQNLKKGFRKNIDRRRRKMEGDHDNVQWQTFTTPEEIDAAMEFIRTERSRRFKGDVLASDAYFAFYKACALEGAATGETVTSGIMVDGKIVSADFGVMGKDCVHSILCAADIDNFGTYAPGIQSLHDLIWERSVRGDTHFDAGLGGSRYKSDFAAREVQLDNLSVSLSLKGQAVAAVYHRSKPLKNFLRDMVRKVH
ncbi:MAG: GNAT family N-acetyltransferase [Rhizobiaceae bacterium]|nr:GNAT family N-acetyltransferase [Rhizobiaceae bacterium]